MLSHHSLPLVFLKLCALWGNTSIPAHGTRLLLAISQLPSRNVLEHTGSADPCARCTGVASPPFWLESSLGHQISPLVACYPLARTQQPLSSASHLMYGLGHMPLLPLLSFLYLTAAPKVLCFYGSSNCTKLLLVCSPWFSCPFSLSLPPAPP